MIARGQSLYFNNHYFEGNVEVDQNPLITTRLRAHKLIKTHLIWCIQQLTRCLHYFLVGMECRSLRQRRFIMCLASLISDASNHQKQELRQARTEQLSLLLLFCPQGVSQAPLSIMAPGQNANLHHTGPRSKIKKTIKSSKLKSKKKGFKGLISKGSFRLAQSQKKK